MILSQSRKKNIKRELVDVLSKEKEVTRVIVFGSFITSTDPHDLDIAIFQDSNDDYLTLAMRYRKDVRPIAQQIPLDVIPIKTGINNDPFLKEINKGETIYER